MKAVQFDRVGGPEVIRLVDLPIPVPNRKEVRVKVEACGLNFSDTMIRQGRYLMAVPCENPNAFSDDVQGLLESCADVIKPLWRR